MKKLSYFIFILCFANILYGCSLNSLKTSLSGKKPTPYFYTNALINAIKSDDISKTIALETNLQKEKDLTNDDILTLKKFIECLESKNFIDSPEDLPEKPLYKIYISTGTKRYIINVYNERYISLYPWDGTYSMDYIDMSNIKSLYNLYNLCSFIFKK